VSPASARPRPRDPESLYFRALEPKALGQRERMLDAMARAVAAHGYARVTVADVVALAGVSRSTFYEHFSDKEECFLESYAVGARATIEQAASAVLESGFEDWHDRVRVGMTAFLEILAANPAVARALLVDVMGAGPRAVQQRREVFAAFADLYRIDGVPDPLIRALVGGIAELVQEHIETRGAESVDELAPTLIELAYSIVEAGLR
jgi:AcrR family transcriptional regulator